MLNRITAKRQVLVLNKIPKHQSHGIVHRFKKINARKLACIKLENLVFRLSIFILRELIISSSSATKSLNKSNNKITEQSSKGKGKTHMSTNR
jgi:hypothetical protein